MVEVAHNQFAVVLAEFDAIEPEFLVLAMGVPRTGLLLSDAEDDAFDDIDQGSRASGNLARHAEALSGSNVKYLLSVHGPDYIRAGGGHAEPLPAAAGHQKKVGARLTPTGVRTEWTEEARIDSILFPDHNLEKFDEPPRTTRVSICVLREQGLTGTGSKIPDQGFPGLIGQGLFRVFSRL